MKSVLRHDLCRQHFLDAYLIGQGISILVTGVKLDQNSGLANNQISIFDLRDFGCCILTAACAIFFRVTEKVQ